MKPVTIPEGLVRRLYRAARIERLARVAEARRRAQKRGPVPSWIRRSQDVTVTAAPTRKEDVA